jgi:hypothetical protein
MKKVCILLVLLTRVYHDARFRQREITTTRCVITTQKSAVLEEELF